MTYNILYYGETTSFCDNSNNNIAAKDAYLEKIAKHVDPDILVVNEMGASAVYSNRIINNALNVDGENKYKACPVQNNSFSSIVNGVFYNKKKLVLHRQQKMTLDVNNNNIVRAIDFDQFYYNDPYLNADSDTVFFTVVAVHLKAGSQSSDESARAIACESIIDYMDTQFGPGNYLLCGDLNLKKASSDAYQNLSKASNGEFQYVDPVDQEGSWNNSSSYAAFHTQSTRSGNTNNGCFSGGGMDDRFDFILMTNQVMQDTGGLRYVDGSYTTVGQDGNHFNKAINDGSNNSVPSAVLGALYEMSDHLPVYADVAVKLLNEPIDTSDTNVGVRGMYQQNLATIWVQSNELRLKIHQLGAEVDLVAMDGRHISLGEVKQGYNTRSLEGLRAGLYVVRLRNAHGVQVKTIWVGH